jgi:phosphatidylserine/phosphatidylglycerophosphate/cardiolipin synthase-like enzyme
MKSTLALLSLAIALACPGVATARTKHRSLVQAAVSAYEQQHTFQLPATGSIEVAFSPDEGSEHLVIKVIDAAQSELRLLSYSFTSAAVVDALIRARHRGVAVTLVADEKNNIKEDRSGKARAALSALVNAGAEVRVISVYPIHHDKVIIADRDTVELGSFNFSDAAAHKNSENVLVNWHNPQLAQVYLGHFARNYKLSAPYQMQY